MLFSLILVAFLAHEPAQGPVVTPFPTFGDAVQMANEGRDADALLAFQRIVSSNPNDHEARLWIARLHVRMGHMDLAEAVYRSVLLEDPNNVEAMLGVGAALLDRGETSDAIAMFERAQKLAPQSDLVLDWLGRAHRQAGRPERAIVYYEQVVALSPTEQHRISLEDARRAYFHRVETRGFNEQFNGSTPDSRSGEIAVNYRLNERLRVNGRGQVQRKFGIRDERGGGGVEWKWMPSITLRGQALVGPDAAVMPEGDYLGEVDYAHYLASWTLAFRYFDFNGARAHVVSPAVSWMAADRLSVGIRYALSLSESNTLPSRTAGHTLHVLGAYQLYPRLSITGGYKGGVDDFENFSIDRIGDFRANAFSVGARYELPSLTSLVGSYEHQRRERGVTMNRVTVALTQSF
jgi:YaiO family outer membrane protein